MHIVDRLTIVLEQAWWCVIKIDPSMRSVEKKQIK